MMGISMNNLKKHHPATQQRNMKTTYNNNIKTQKNAKQQQNNATRKNVNQNYRILNPQGVFICFGTTSQCFPLPLH
jgi:hypothetical protein